VQNRDRGSKNEPAAKKLVVFLFSHSLHGTSLLNHIHRNFAFNLVFSYSLNEVSPHDAVIMQLMFMFSVSLLSGYELSRLNVGLLIIDNKRAQCQYQAFTSVPVSFCKTKIFFPV